MGAAHLSGSDGKLSPHDVELKDPIDLKTFFFPPCHSALAISLPPAVAPRNREEIRLLEVWACLPESSSRRSHAWHPHLPASLGSPSCAPTVSPILARSAVWIQPQGAGGAAFAAKTTPAMRKTSSGLALQNTESRIQVRTDPEVPFFSIIHMYLFVVLVPSSTQENLLSFNNSIQTPHANFSANPHAPKS